MTTWVEEFHDFAGNGTNGGGNQFGSLTTGGGMKSTFVPRKPSRKETIESELKLLEWHKLANDAALKAALMQTKQLHDPPPKRDPSLDEEAKRIRKIITNEQTKPLEVSRDFVLKYEKKELADSEQLASQVERHIDTLRNIRGKLEERLELKSRINDYRDWRKGFEEKKLAVLNGKTISNFEQSKQSQSLVPSPSNPQNKIRTTSGQGQSNGRDLATVLDSLNKLAQLEARISSLERDNENMYEKMKNDETNMTFEQERDKDRREKEAEKTALEFRKKRAADPLRGGGKSGAVKTVYTIKTKKVPMSKGVKERLPGGGTFLTAVGDRGETNLRDARNREKQRQIALSTAGQKQLRERVKIKKTYQLESLNSHRKHEEALQEMKKRKSEQHQKMKEKRTSPLIGLGASSGKKFKNKYLEDFHKIKKEHQAKKDQRRLGAVKEKEYISSATAPTGGIRPSDSSHTNTLLPRRPIATKTAGTVTRRANSVPVRRGETDRRERDRNSSGGDFAMPPIVGSGVGGVRALKEQQNRRK